MHRCYLTTGIIAKRAMTLMRKMAIMKKRIMMIECLRYYAKGDGRDSDDDDEDRDEETRPVINHARVDNNEDLNYNFYGVDHMIRCRSCSCNGSSSRIRCGFNIQNSHSQFSKFCSVISVVGMKVSYLINNTFPRRVSISMRSTDIIKDLD